MTIVARGHGFIACSFSDETVKWERSGRKPVYFDFSEMFGPLFTNADGKPLKNQPIPTPRSRHWQAFDEWRVARVAQADGASGD